MHEHEKEEKAPQEGEKSAKADAGKKAGGSMKSMLIGLVVALVVLGAGAVLIMTLGIYKLGWEGPAAQVITRTFPYPAAVVNGKSIRYSDFLEDVATLHRFFDGQAASGAPAEALPDESEIRKNALDRLVFNVVLQEVADERGVVVTEEDLDAELAKLTAQSGGEEKIAAEIESLYGWSIEEFKGKVIWSFVMQNKVAESLRTDEELVAAAMAEAQQVLDELEAGGDFAELAMQHSDDQATAAVGGDLGSFGRGIMVPEFETAAFALEEGEISDIVETPYGYHIIRVDSVEKEGDEVTSVTASHILIMPANADTYLADRIDSADVVTYVEI